MICDALIVVLILRMNSIWTESYTQCFILCLVQEEPEEIYETSHPSIVPLKEAAQRAEEQGKVNYITVHYSRMPRLNTVTQSMCADVHQSSVILMP